jgi:hypothetical protein
MLMFVSVGRAQRREKVTGFWDKTLSIPDMGSYAEPIDYLRVQKTLPRPYVRYARIQEAQLGFRAIVRPAKAGMFSGR